MIEFQSNRFPSSFVLSVVISPVFRDTSHSPTLYVSNTPHTGLHFSLVWDADSVNSIFELLHLRNMIWEGQQFSVEQRQFWLVAKKNLPDWPGFRREKLSNDQREAVIWCEQEVDVFWETVVKETPLHTDRITIESNLDGTTNISFQLNPIQASRMRDIGHLGNSGQHLDVHIPCNVIFDYLQPTLLR